MTISTFDSPRDSERERNAQRYDDDATLDEPIVARERADERARGAARHDAAARAADDAPHDFGTSYLGGSSDEQWQKWRQIQADFVDNPRSAVSDAHRLVGEMMDDIVRRFGRFPHRNAALGRESTPDEIEFLKQPGSAF